MLIHTKISFRSKNIPTSSNIPQGKHHISRSKKNIYVLSFAIESKSDIPQTSIIQTVDSKRRFHLVHRNEGVQKKMLMLYSCLIIKLVQLNQPFHSQKIIFTKKAKREEK